MGTDHSIRRLREEDLRAAIELIWAVFQEFEAPDYSERGIQEFRDFIEHQTIAQKVRAGEMKLWGCIKQNRIVGVIATVRGNHVSLLFVDKQYHRQGIARALHGAALEDCRRGGGHSAMTVNSSPYAVEAYHRLGFADTDTEQLVNGLRFTPMVYNFG